MPAKIESSVESPAVRVLALLKKFPKHAERKVGDRLSPALVREVNEVAKDASTYLGVRVKEVEKFRAHSVAQTRLSKLEEEIKSLSEKQDKSENDYSRLIILERQASDLLAAVESDSGTAGEAEELLNQEIREWACDLASALSTVTLDDLLSRACSAIKPFCGDQAPHAYALALPALRAHSLRFTQAFNPRRAGLENARAVIALIGQTIG